MKNLLATFLAFIAFANLSSAATAPCDVFLAAPSSAEAIRSYVSLLRYYISHNYDGDQVLQRVANSKVFIDPFKYSKDSLAIQLSKGIAKITPQLKAIDWSTIQDHVALLAKTNQAEKSDRSTKAEEIRPMFSPKVIPNALGDLSGAEVAWQIVDGHVYAAAAFSSHNIHLFELVGDQLTELDRLSTSEVMTDSPVWHLSQGKVLLAARGADLSVSVFELQNKKLLKRDEVKFESRVSGAVSWNDIDSKPFLAAGAGNHYLHIYEYRNDKLIKYASGPTEGNLSGSPTWLEANGRIFFAGAFTPSHHRIYEIEDAKISHRAVISTSPMQDPLTWHVLGNRFVAICVKNSHLLPIEFNGKDLFELNAIPSEGMDFASPSWWREGERLYAMAGMFSGEMQIFEFKDTSLQMLSKASIGSLTAASSWISFNERSIAASQSDDGYIYFHEFVSGDLVALGRVSSNINHYPEKIEWLETQSGLYLAIQAEREHLLVRVH